jgi:hypothetical protein
MWKEHCFVGEAVAIIVKSCIQYSFEKDYFDFLQGV